MLGKERHGSITLELLLTIPVLTMLVLGGIALAYATYAKAALQMTAMRVARELSASDAAARIENPHVAYRYGDFTETYGLPRPKVRVSVGRVAGSTGGVIVAGACIRVPAPIPLPQSGRASGPERSSLQVDPKSVAGQLRGVYEQVEETMAGVVHLTQQALRLWLSIKDFHGGLNLPEFEEKAGGEVHSFITPEQFDEAVRLRCGGDGIIVTARAAFLSESGTPERATPLKITLGQNPIDVRGTLYRHESINVWAQSRTRCNITLLFPSGISTADEVTGDNASKETDQSGAVAWTPRISSGTTNGATVPVSVICQNGQRGEAELHVISNRMPRGAEEDSP